MADENLLATLEGSLRQTRATRGRLSARLLELELEAEKLRTEIGEMEQLATQTESAMFRIMSSMLSRDSSSSPQPVPGYERGGNYNRLTPTDAQIEAALREDQSRAEVTNAYSDVRYNPPQGISSDRNPVSLPLVRTAMTPMGNEVEARSDRFLDRTIPQAAALLLRESGAPLHVNELYNQLLEGGFQFNGQNPTISIAVSLNRNRRFRKVAPGTFDLTIRDAAQVS